MYFDFEPLFLFTFVVEKFSFAKALAVFFKLDKLIFIFVFPIWICTSLDLLGKLITVPIVLKGITSTNIPNWISDLVKLPFSFWGISNCFILSFSEFLKLFADFKSWFILFSCLIISLASSLADKSIFLASSFAVSINSFSFCLTPVFSFSSSFLRVWIWAKFLSISCFSRSICNLLS